MACSRWCALSIIWLPSCTDPGCDTPVLCLQSKRYARLGQHPLSGAHLLDVMTRTRAITSHAIMTGMPAQLMVDPDAPSPEDPKFAEFLHWVVDDIPNGALPQAPSPVAMHTEYKRSSNPALVDCGAP